MIKDTLKVKELIALLEKCDPERPVVIPTRVAHVSVIGASESNCPNCGGDVVYIDIDD